jgi:ribokinase
MTAFGQDPRLCVVGSVNLDTVHTVTDLPRPGQTVASLGTATFPGGKGLNQAIAAARAGVPTSLVAAVGDDEGARVTLAALADAGVDLRGVRRCHLRSGAATVVVDGEGNNVIVVDAGANAWLRHLTGEDEAAIRASAAVLCQFELPVGVVLEAAAASRRSGATFVLNPSPVRPIPPELLRLVDVLVVNEREGRQLGVGSLAVETVVTTLGERGVHLRRGTVEVSLPARPATAVDTTGAGDTFTGVFAAELVLGATVEDAARRAVVAASLAVERSGASTSIPCRSEVDVALGTTALGGRP